MVLEVGFVVAAFTSIFTIVNPFSTASVFLGLTKEETHAERKLIARKATLFSATLLLVFAFAGSAILAFFSITIDAFRLAGGLLIAAVGWQMIRAKRERFNHDNPEDVLEREDISIIPLAVPFLAGPGAITTVLVLISESTGPVVTVQVAIAILFVMALSYLVLSESDRIVRYLGASGREAVEKIMGLIVLVVGVQFVINAIRALLVAWGVV